MNDVDDIYQKTDASFNFRYNTTFISRRSDINTDIKFLAMKCNKPRKLRRGMFFRIHFFKNCFLLFKIDLCLSFLPKSQKSPFK